MTKTTEPEITPEEPPAEPPAEPTPATITPGEKILLAALMLADSGTAPPCLLERPTVH